MKMKMNSFPLVSVETPGVSPDIFQQCFALKRTEPYATKPRSLRKLRHFSDYGWVRPVVMPTST